MKRNKLLECIGFKFIVNHESKEIHRVNLLTQNCFVKKMKNSVYSTLWSVKRLLKKGYNGCTHCYKSKDTDK